MDNIDIIEPDKDELEILADYRAKGKVEEDFFPLTTYELVQSGYPVPTHGVMVARVWGGTDAEGNLLSGSGEFCKVEDVKGLLAVLRKVERAARATGDYIGQDGQLIKEVRAALGATPTP